MAFKDKFNLVDLDLLDFGTNLQIVGVVFGGREGIYVAPFPDEHLSPDVEIYHFEFNTKEWEDVISQSDLLNVEVGTEKALVRKSQRQIDANVAWAVYERDGYRCRYCGRQGPLTVDHIICWEDGGPTITDNLLSSCKKCNRTRGNMPYREWLKSPLYLKAARTLTDFDRDLNIEVLAELPGLEAKKVAHVRSR